MNVVSLKACKWCGLPMSNVAEIAPFAGGPGLVALMCSHCGTTDSVSYLRRTSPSPARVSWIINFATARIKDASQSHHSTSVRSQMISLKK
jgi:hypothetical protein